MKFFIEAIGCQQNGYDASRLAIFLKSAGLFESSAEESDIIFILACSVRQTAVDRIFGRIRNWNAKSPSGKKTSHQIIVTSCLTPDDQKKIIERGVSYWEFGDIESLEKIIGEKFNNRTIEQSSDSVYIPIMIGCNNFCSYCIVPYTRGRERSRPADEVILEASELIKSGKKQIILLGQNVNSYEFGFTKLLKDLDD